MKNNYNEQSNISVDGHCVIKDIDTGEVLLDKHNAINFQNFAFEIDRLNAFENTFLKVSGLFEFNNSSRFFFKASL